MTCGRFAWPMRGLRLVVIIVGVTIALRVSPAVAHIADKSFCLQWLDPDVPAALLAASSLEPSNSEPSRVAPVPQAAWGGLAVLGGIILHQIRSRRR